MGDDKDVDLRFREIIGAEFGSEPRGRRTRPRANRSEPLADDFNFTEAMDHAEVDLDSAGHYVPEPLPPVRPAKRHTVAGAILMATGVAIALLGLFGATFSRPLAWGGSVAALVGLALLLTTAPRKDADQPWDNGAVL